MPRHALFCLLASAIALASPEVRAQARPRLRIIISSNLVNWIDPATLEASARPLFAHVAGPYPDITYSVRTGTSSQQVQRALVSNEANAAMLTSEEYLSLTGVKVTTVVQSSRTGNPFYLRVITRAASPISSVKDLAGKRVSVSAHEPTQRVYLETLLGRAKIGRAIVRERRDAKSPVLDVLLGEAEAGVVASPVLAAMAELNPQLRRRLRAICQSEELATPPIVVRADMEPRVHRALREVMLSLHTTPRGRELLLMFRVQRLIPARDSDYDSYRRLLAEHRRHQRGKD